MANRVLAYISSACLIVYSVLTWVLTVTSHAGHTAGAAAGLDQWWAEVGCAASGIATIRVLRSPKPRRRSQIGAMLLNVLNIAAGACVFAAAESAELAATGGAIVFVGLGSMFILAGLVNIGAIWQTPAFIPYANRPEPHAHDRSQDTTIANCRLATRPSGVKPGIELERDSAAPRRGRGRALYTSLGCCALAVGATTFIWLHAGPCTATGGPTKSATQLTADQVFKSASPSVVKVLVRDSAFQVVGQGSGFYVSPDGRLVTNYHVIQVARFATILEADGTTRSVDAVIAADPDTDLAILKVFRTGGPILRLSASIPAVGAKVYALGNPQGFTNTLSEGIISGLRTDNVSLPAIQTTAAISPGSSGGPLIGDNGEVIGVTTSFWSTGQSLNFAVPATRVISLLNTPTDRAASIALIPSNNAKKTTDKLLLDSWERMDREDYRGALDELDPLRDSEGDNPIYLYTVGRLHYLLCNYESSIEALNRAVAIAPKVGEFYSLRGEARFGAKQWAEAVDDLWQASQFGVKNARLYTYAGECYAALGDAVRAEKCYRRALSLDRRYQWAYLFFSRLCPDARGDPLTGSASGLPAAIQVLNEGILENPGDAMLYLEAGDVYAKMNNYDRAFAMWSNAVRFDPNGDWGKSAKARLAGATE